jgi:hypothetical protein
MFRFPQAEIDGDVVALLRKKYGGLRVDVVVAASEIALDIAERHRADIWPEVPIVFHSVPWIRAPSAFPSAWSTDRRSTWP